MVTECAETKQKTEPGELLQEMYLSRGILTDKLELKDGVTFQMEAWRLIGTSFQGSEWNTERQEMW